jgi:hypothetical protein
LGVEKKKRRATVTNDLEMVKLQRAMKFPNCGGGDSDECYSVALTTAFHIQLVFFSAACRSNREVGKRRASSAAGTIDKGTVTAHS